MKSFTIIIFFMLLVLSCSTDTKKEKFNKKFTVDESHQFHRPLSQQRLIPRPEYEGHLTNRVCLKWNNSECDLESVKKYSINDKSIRKHLIEFQFACNIGGKRYRICPNRAGFCRKEKYKICKKWGKKFFTRKKICRKWEEKIINKFISINKYQFLLDGSTECKKGL